MAGKVLTVGVLLLRPLSIDKVEKHETISQFECSLDGVSKSRLALSLCSQAIDDHLNRVLLLLLQLRRLGKLNRLAINAGA